MLVNRPISIFTRLPCCLYQNKRCLNSQKKLTAFVTDFPREPFVKKIFDVEFPEKGHNPPSFPPNWNFPKPELPKDDESQPYQPAKLHMVWRVRPMRGLPHYEKKILDEFDLIGKPSEFVIVKNIPEINKRLWKIKHLIRIKPITFPNGLPKDGDPTGTFLKHTGEFIVSEKLKVDPELLKEDTEFETLKLETRRIRQHLLSKWNKPIDYYLKYK